MSNDPLCIEDRIHLIGREVERIATVLRNLGYWFNNPSAVFPGPEADAAASIARIEHEVGRLPLAIKLFWQHVGSVNFIGAQPDWHGCEYPDPLVVFPPSIAIDELDEFLADYDERIGYNGPFRVPISPDDYHKQNVSGGMWYNLEVPAVVDDPPLRNERHHATFLEYLELSVLWGGFSGLDRCAQHDWPLTELRGGSASQVF